MGYGKRKREWFNACYASYENVFIVNEIIFRCKITCGICMNCLLIESSIHNVLGKDFFLRGLRKSSCEIFGLHARHEYGLLQMRSQHVQAVEF